MSELRNSATLTVSGEYDGNYSKDKAIDGDTGTSWSSATQANNSWIQFDWGAPVTIKEIRLICRDSAWGQPKFTFSDNAFIEWNTSLYANKDRIYRLQTPKSTTSLRISVVTGADGNNGFKEIYINDAYSPDPPTDITNAPTIDVSSFYDNSYTKENVLDSAATDWAVNGDGSSSWIKFAWPSNVRFDSIDLWDRNDGVNRWGTPKFIFDDASEQNGGSAVSNLGFTTYTLVPKISKSIKISVLSGGSGNNRGFQEVILTGLLNLSGIPSIHQISPTGAIIIG